VKVKRLISCLLVVCLLTGIVTMAAAAEEPTISVSSGNAKAGGSVTLTVSIKNNPGLAAWVIYLYYDTSVFSVDPGSDLAASGSFRSAGGLVGNSIENARKNGRYSGDAGKDGVLALWYNGSGRNTSSDGAMLTVTLHVSDDASNGTYQIGVDYSESDTGNKDGEKIALATKAGSVTVSGGSTDGGGETNQQPQEMPFSDIDGHWAEDFIEDAYQLELMVGSDGLFRPDDTLTRGEFAVVLWRIAGCPEPAKEASFPDLTADWYKDAVAWVEESGMMIGNDKGEFLPTGIVTREQVVTVLHRMAGSPAGMGNMFTSLYDSQYSDSDQIGSWAKQGVYWSLYEGIYCGQNSLNVGGRLASTAVATRAQIAVMMVRYWENG